MKNKDTFWELAVAKLHDEISDVESEELSALRENEENERLYNKIESLKKDISETEVISNISQNDSWKTISTHFRRKTMQRFSPIMKYAAIIVIAFLLGTIITNQFSKYNQSVSFAEVIVPLGQMSEMTLYDGTKVWLNSGTTLRYSSSFGKEDRNISLDGEAFFEVTKDEVPFKVKLKGTEVEVLGTSFNVVSYMDEDYSEITLVEGKVNVNDHLGANIAELKPSDQIHIDCKLKKTVINKVSTEFYTSWTEGKIVFDDENLLEISRKLERWYNVDIKFGEDSIGDLHFSGTILKHKPVNQILVAFELLLPVKVKYKNNPNGKDLIVISQK